MPPPRDAVQNLPVFQAVAIAYRATIGQTEDLCRAAFLPFLLSLVIALSTPAVGRDPFLITLLNLLSLVPYTLFGVAWHRFVLLGPGAARPPVWPGWTRRHWRFMGYALAVTLISYVVFTVYMLLFAVLTGAGPGPEGARDPGLLMTGVMVGLILLSYVFLRLSFVFPAAAVGETYLLSHSWRHTRRQALRLLAAMFLTLLPPVLAALLIHAAVFGHLPGAMAEPEAAAPGGVALMALNLAWLALSYIALALTIAIISAAFRICTGWVPTAPGPPAGPVAGGG